MSTESPNPYEASKPAISDRDLKTSKHIDSLYRNNKQMVLLTCLGMFIPFILLFAAPLGLLYAIQRSRLLKNVSSGSIQILDQDSDKILFLRKHSLRFYAPVIVFGLLLLLLILTILTIS